MKLNKANVSYLNKKIEKERKKTIEKKKAEISETKQELKIAKQAKAELVDVRDQLNKSLSDLEVKSVELNEIKTEKKNLQSLLSYYKNKDNKQLSNIEIMTEVRRRRPRVV